MNHTKLFKIFNNRNCFLVIWALLILTACEEENKTENPADFLKGNWQFSSIETNETVTLDEESRKIYDEQIAEFTTNSILSLSDSTYTCTLGNTKETGLWKYDPQDSILSLKSTKKYVQLFHVFIRSKILKLELKNSKSKEYWLLQKKKTGK